MLHQTNTIPVVTCGVSFNGTRALNSLFLNVCIKTQTGLNMEESVRMADDRHKWRKYVHGVASSRIEDG